MRGWTGWSRAGLLNGSLVENVCVYGGRRRADSASKAEEECMCGVCVFMTSNKCMGVYVCTMYLCQWVCALEWFRVTQCDGRT